MAKYLFLLMSAEDAAGAPSKEVMTWWGEQARSGKILAGDQLAGRETATTIRFSPRGPLVTDGPYMEAKELIGGYALVDVADLDEAIALAKSWPANTMVTSVEIRPLAEM